MLLTFGFFALDAVFVLADFAGVFSGGFGHGIDPFENEKRGEKIYPKKITRITLEINHIAMQRSGARVFLSCQV